MAMSSANGLSAGALGSSEFAWIANLVRYRTGIHLHLGKVELVRSRLQRRLRQLGLPDYRAYIDFLRQEASGAELTWMLDALSTHQTSFFREAHHFTYLARRFLPAVRGRRLRLWSAGCASGEEPYSMAITLLNQLHDLVQWDVKILATDLSQRCVEKTRAGVFAGESVHSLPAVLLQRYFEPCSHDRSPLWRAGVELRRLVHPARLNLAHLWPMSGPFDAIFCCNVMIYLTAEMKHDIVSRFTALLRPGGVLCIGASESLAEVPLGLCYRQPTIYERSH